MTTNPRGRNLLKAMPQATAEASVPGLTALRTGIPAVDRWGAAVVEHLEVRAGVRGPSFEKWMTLRDLDQRGLVGGPARTSMPGDFTGVAIWTSQGKMQYLTLQTMADAMASLLTTSTASSPVQQDAAGQVTKEQFDALERRVSGIQTGTTPAELAARLAQLQTSLRQEWERAIADAVARAVAGVSGQINDLSGQLALARADAQRKWLGYAHVQTTSSATWTVDHRLNRFPIVQVFNASDEEVAADIAFTDENTVTVTHSAAMTGTVVCR